MTPWRDRGRRRKAQPQWMKRKRRLPPLLRPRNPLRTAFIALGLPYPPSARLVAGAVAVVFLLGLAIGIGAASLSWEEPAAPAPLQTAATPALQWPPPDEAAPEYGEEGIDDAYLHTMPEPMPPAAAAPAPEVKPEAKPEAKPALPRVELAALPLPAATTIRPPADPPWRRNAVPAPKSDGRPRIAVVIDDLGLDRHRSNEIVRLPGPLTTAWLTYAHDLPAQTAAARAAGHELLIHMAMEPKNARLDAGPDVLLVRHDEAHIRRKLDDVFARFPGVVGINNHMGSLFTAEPRGMAVVMGELRRQGLLWLDSRTAGHSVGADLARRYNVPFAERNVFLDNDNDVGHVRTQLDALERSARAHGYAIGIGHPRDGTIGALKGWLPKLASRGFVLVPVSALVTHPGAPDRNPAPAAR